MRFSSLHKECIKFFIMNYTKKHLANLKDKQLTNKEATKVKGGGGVGEVFTGEL